jgi:hypothetical protein
MILSQKYDNKTDDSDSIKTYVCSFFSTYLWMIHNVNRTVKRNHLDYRYNNQKKVFKVVSHCSVSC